MEDDGMGDDTESARDVRPESPPGPPAGAPVVHLERMTWPQVEEALDAGMTTVLVACGAVEQHGPHLPLLVDSEHGTHLAAEVARRLGDALVAPTIRVGCSEHHLDFPGTVSLQTETFEAVCRDYTTSLARHGFRTIAFLPSHGGNFRPLAEMVERLDRAAGDGTRVVAFTDLMAVMRTWRRIAEEEAGLGGRVGGHADVAESSILLHLFPDLVRRDRAEAGYTADLEPETFDRVLTEGFRSVTENGILGNPRGMTARIGRRCVAALADLVAGRLRAGRDGG